MSNFFFENDLQNLIKIFYLLLFTNKLQSAWWKNIGIIIPIL